MPKMMKLPAISAMGSEYAYEKSFCKEKSTISLATISLAVPR